MQETMEVKDKPVFSRQKLSTIVNQVIVGRNAFKPNPEDDDPAPWPWRHVLNKALERMITSKGFNSLSWSSLNPQPLPPKWNFAIALAEEVIEKASMLQMVADSFSDRGDQRSIIIVSGYINKFVDDICPTPPVIKVPKKGPWPPDPEPDPRWSGLDLAIMGTLFQNEARMLDGAGMQHALHEAGEKLIQVGVSRL